MHRMTHIFGLELTCLFLLAYAPFSTAGTLIVESTYGTASPEVGTNEINNAIRCRMTTPIIDLGTTQYLCTGWIGTGSVPEAGTGTVTDRFSVTTNSTITWLWQTNVWISLSNAVPKGGFLFSESQWVPIGSTQRVEYSSFQDYHLTGWEGDVPTSNTLDQPLLVIMDEAKSLTANFAINTDTNGATIPPRVTFSPTPTLTNFALTFSDTALQGLVQDNLSGCTINPHTGELIGVLNNGDNTTPNEGIQIYTQDGTYVRRIELEGFDDTEGICSYNTDSNLYAVIEEAIGDIAIIEITSDTTHIAKSNAVQVISTGYTNAGGSQANKAWEGITYDPDNHCFYLVKEKYLMGVARVTWTTNEVYTQWLFDAQSVLTGICTDLSDVTYDPVTGHLLLLSEESEKVVECTLDGQVIRELSTPGEQVEGVYLTPDRSTLHVVGEKVEYYRYELQPLTAQGPEGTPLTAHLELSWPVTNALYVDYSISSTNATPGDDYSPVTGRVTFAAEQTNSTSAPIQIPYDGTGENDEHLMLTLTNAQDATIGWGDAFIYTIQANTSADPTTDADGDGLPDMWEETYFGSTNAPNGGAQDDWDNDSLLNADEYVAGTDPTNSASLLQLIHATKTEESVNLWWDSVTNRTYALYRSTNLNAGWDNTPVLSGIAGEESGTNSISHNTAFPQAFYRISVDSQP
ncbi:MAG: SdiA-regulated domain-containing protein [Kiritimatiellae bacterium]|nr:SdiA-regulated domain-containing protein [Kiritimatiellia bacterium]